MALPPSDDYKLPSARSMHVDTLREIFKLNDKQALRLYDTLCEIAKEEPYAEESEEGSMMGGKGSMGGKDSALLIGIGKPRK